MPNLPSVQESSFFPQRSQVPFSECDMSGVNGAWNPSLPLSMAGECRGVKIQVQTLNPGQPSLSDSNHGHLRKCVSQVNPNFSGEVRVRSCCFLLLEHTLKIPNSLQTLPWEDLRDASGLLFPWLQPWLLEQASLSSVRREGDSGIKINIAPNSWQRKTGSLTTPVQGSTKECSMWWWWGTQNMQKGVPRD